MSRHDRASDLLVVGISGTIASHIVTVGRSGIAGSIAATGRHRVDATGGGVTASRRNNDGVTVGGCGASGCSVGGIITISRHRGRVRRATIVGGWCACIAVDGHITRNRAISRRSNYIARSEITVNRRSVNTARCHRIGTDLTWRTCWSPCRTHLYTDFWSSDLITSGIKTASNAGVTEAFWRHGGIRIASHLENVILPTGVEGGPGTDRRPLPGLGVSEITLSRSEPNRHDRRLICEIIAHSSSLSPGGRHCGHA